MNTKLIDGIVKITSTQHFAEFLLK